MDKDATYQEKFASVKIWSEDIIETVRKDLKNEHLSRDPHFCRKYFLGKKHSEIDTKTFSEAYVTAIDSGNVGLAEFIATRWLLKNTDIYGYFEEKLKLINPDFESIIELEESVSQSLIAYAITQFGAAKTYIFSLFNSVAFSKKIYQDLKDQAEKETFEKRKVNKEDEEKQTLLELQKRHDREMKAMKERFEKKLNGFQKKYLHDTEMLKKKIAELQDKYA
jgi:hypothetical protein